MIKLHGFPYSNYYNIVKMALMEKGVEYEDVRIFTSQDEAMLAKSPMGKVPFMETEHGFLCETSVMLDYIEDALPGPSFYPAEPFAKARVRELIKFCELYLELPARRCFGEVSFGGGPTPEATKEEVLKTMQRGLRAVRQNANFGPYLAGAELTYADFVFLQTFPPACLVAKTLFEWDLFADLPGASNLMDILRARDTVKTIDADQKAGLQEFKEAYGIR